MKRIFSILLLLIIVSSSFAQKVKPALHLVKGTTYYMASSATSAIVQILNSQENNITLTYKYSMAFKVTDILDTLYKMEVSYMDIDMKIQTAGRTIEMSSKKNDTTDIPSSIIAAMMGRPFNIMLTKSGRIKSVDNIDKMFNNVFDGFPQIDTVKKAQLKSQLMQSFGAAAFKGTFEMGTAIFPNNPVVKGDKWNINTHLESPTGINVQTIYQLTDIAGNFYLIHGDGTMTTDKNAPLGTINGMPMKYDLSGTTLTDIMVDKTTGWINEVKLKQVMQGSIAIQDNPKLPGGITIPMTFNTDVLTTTEK